MAKYDTTFGQTLVQVDLWSDVPPRQRCLVAKCDTIAGQSGASSHGNSSSISIY